MELGSALAIVKKGLAEAVQGKHFKEMCAERELDQSMLRDSINARKIAGIRHQPEISLGRYLLTFKDQPNKDLNVAVEIINSKRVRLVTIFPERKGRRDKR